MVTTRRASIVRVVYVQKRSKLWKTHDERTIIVRFLKNVDQTQTVRSTSNACRTFAASSLRTVYVFFRRTFDVRSSYDDRASSTDIVR